MCKVCGDKKMVTVPIEKLVRSRNQYHRDFEITKTVIGGIDACYFCATEAEQDYQEWMEGKHDRFI